MKTAFVHVPHTRKMVQEARRPGIAFLMVLLYVFMCSCVCVCAHVCTWLGGCQEGCSTSLFSISEPSPLPNMGPGTPGGLPTHVHMCAETSLPKAL